MERKVNETSQLHQEWDQGINIGSQFSEVVIILQNRAWFSHNWESIAQL